VKGRRPQLAGGPAPRYLLLGATVFLVLAGLVMIFSAAYASDLVRYGTKTHHFVRQLMNVAGGLLVLVVASRFDYRLLGKYWKAVWVGSVALLVTVLVLGVVRGGARRWIPLGIMNLQPSELAKVACVIVAAYLVVEWRRGHLDEKAFLIRVAAATAIPVALIIVQPDLGTTLALAIGVGIVLFLGGIRTSWIAAILASGVGMGILGIIIEPYRIKRVVAFLDPWADPQGKGYQTVQALLAFGTGGVDGLGLGMSRQKFFYLPEAHTDFIFAIIGEEIGLIGTLAIIVGFAVFAYAGMRIALGSRDLFGRMLAGGLTGTIVVQAVMNMAAVTSLMPVTGKPMPFVSFGGSSMLVTMLCVGLIMSVSRYGACAPRAVRRPHNQGTESVRANRDERRGDRGPHLSRTGDRRGVRRRA